MDDPCETRFFKNFPSFAFKALAEILGIGVTGYTSTPYVFQRGRLPVDYARTTRGSDRSAGPVVTADDTGVRAPVGPRGG